MSVKLGCSQIPICYNSAILTQTSSPQNIFWSLAANVENIEKGCPGPSLFAVDLPNFLLIFFLSYLSAPSPALNLEAYSEHSQTSKMDDFCVNS